MRATELSWVELWVWAGVGAVVYVLGSAVVLTVVVWLGMVLT